MYNNVVKKHMYKIERSLPLYDPFNVIKSQLSPIKFKMKYKTQQKK